MLPVSGAEQLNTSGDDRGAAHDLAERRVLEVAEAGAALGNRQEEVPEPALLCALFDSSSMIGVGCQRSPAVDLFGEDALVGNDVLVDEIEDVVAERFDALGDAKVHVSFPSVLVRMQRAVRASDVSNDGVTLVIARADGY